MTQSARTSPKLLIAGSVAAVVVLLSLVAIVRPARPHAANEDGEESSSAPSILAESPEPKAARPPRTLGSDGPCSRPARQAPLAALVRADAAYDTGDYAKAKGLYLNLLLAGGDVDDSTGDTLRWCHGRLALAVARLAIPAASAGIDEPPLLFEAGAR